MSLCSNQFTVAPKIAYPSVLPICLGISLALCSSVVEGAAGPAKSSGQAASAPAAATTQKALLAQPAATATPQQPSAVAGQTVAVNPGSVSTNQVSAAPTALIDFGHPVLGGRVFSTGTENVVLKVLTPSGLPYPEEAITTVIGGQRVRLPNPNVSAYIDNICIVSPGPARVLASNRQYDRTINLGKLPPGEIIFAVKTPSGFFKTGEGSRNADGQAHAIVKTFSSGVIQMWFEDQSGSRLPASDRDYNDAVFELSGGVADHNVVPDVANVSKEH
jgi:hypothetical protein